MRARNDDSKRGVRQRGSRVRRDARTARPVQDAHDALYNAYLTAQVWQQLVPQLGMEGVLRVGDALRVGMRCAWRMRCA